MNRLSKHLLYGLCLGLLWVAQPLPAQSAEPPPELSYTRLLRRITLRVMGRPPTVAEYQALLNATDDTAREALIQETINSGIGSPAFYEQMLHFGFDYLGVGKYGIQWSVAAHLDTCPDDTLHAGKFGAFRTYEQYPSHGDSYFACDAHAGPCQSDGSCPGGFACDGSSSLCLPVSCGSDQDCGSPFYCEASTGICAPITDTIEPWWAPGTTIETIGWAGQGHTSVPDGDDLSTTQDCGVIRTNFMSKETVIHKGADTLRPRCGCGPNLIYCARRGTGWSQGASTGLSYEGYPNDPSGLLSSLFEEPARLFAHIVMNDRPFTDLVLGDYTVVNQGLQHFYHRTARQTGQHAELDSKPWWAIITDPNTWREVVVEEMYPFLLKDRHTQFDPRLDYGEPPGLPSAGVLTTAGSLNSFMRERARAARWLETLTCRQFTPPGPGIEFTPFQVDPATEGVCQHCHQLIDPAAMHFKRFSTVGQRVAGLSPYRWDDISGYGYPLWKEKPRWAAQYLPNTVMTPVTDLDVELNPDTRFLDFAPPDTPLFGQISDGTIGPLGFAKMMVSSGEFDRCTVRRFYQRFMGQTLDPAVHAPYIDELVSVFVGGDRQIRPFVVWLLNRPRFRWGH